MAKPEKYQLDQRKTPLCDVLVQYAGEDRVRLSMPGHKGGMQPKNQLVSAWGTSLWQWDVTELAMTDQLYHAQGCLWESQQLLADFLGAKQGFFLINGSSSGLMAGILSLIQPGERILVPRNAHGSIWRGVALAQGEAVVMPVSIEETYRIPLGIDPKQLEKVILDFHIKAMVAVYPSYHGLCGDIKTIVALCKKYGVKLLVDMAHGGHLPFLPGEIANPISLGADIVVQSWHKTMGSLTQTAVAAVQNDGLAFDKNLLYFQSTSPSYPLMASLEETRRFWAAEGVGLGQGLAFWAEEFADAINQLPGWRTLGAEDFSVPVENKDCTKILLVNDWQLSGFAVADALEKRGIDVEMAEDCVVTIILAVGDLLQKDRILGRVLAALKEITAERKSLAVTTEKKMPSSLRWNQVELLAADAYYGKPRSLVPLQQAVGRVVAEMVSLYPPGVPLLLAGQKITQEDIIVLEEMIAAGGSVQGYDDGGVWVLLDENKLDENK